MQCIEHSYNTTGCGPLNNDNISNTNSLVYYTVKKIVCVGGGEGLSVTPNETYMRV